jgi:hypothetical protein
MRELDDKITSNYIKIMKYYESDLETAIEVLLLKKFLL